MTAAAVQTQLSPGDGPEWDFSVPDWKERLRDGRSLLPELPIDKARGDRAVRIFENLRLPDVAGHQRLSTGAPDWPKDIIRNAFGAQVTERIDDPANDNETEIVVSTKINEVFALVPKKQSKTTYLGGALGLVALLMNTRPRARMIFIAPTQEIADIAFTQAAGMIELDERLKKLFKVNHNLKTITEIARHKAVLAIKTFAMNVVTGAPPSLVIIDELHLIGEHRDGERVLRQIRGARVAIPELLLVILTTQSDKDPAGIFKKELKKARNIRDGEFTGAHVRTLVALYEFPAEIQRHKDKPWTDKKYWPMVMPSLGFSCRIAELEDLYADAESKGLDDVIGWASQHLNIEIGTGLHADRWRAAEHWDANEDKSLTLEALLDRSEVVTVGIDNGGSADLHSVALCGRERKDGEYRWLFWQQSFCYPVAIERSVENASRYQDFIEAKELILCQSEAEGYGLGVSIVEKVLGANLLPEEDAVYCDKGFKGSYYTHLADIGVEAPRVRFLATEYMRAGVEEVEVKAMFGTLSHPGQALLNWAVSNAKVEMKGNVPQITKAVSGAGKIDPVIAMLCAAQAMNRNPQAPQCAARPRLLFV